MAGETLNSVICFQLFVFLSNTLNSNLFLLAAHCCDSIYISILWLNGRVESLMVSRSALFQCVNVCERRQSED